MPNALAQESSPYLLQHVDNPVAWYPWGPEALARARAEDKPIFLSIGYSACHWCHVMAHECFENAEIAALMNHDFINIKVDREERPDLDQIYMEAVLLIDGHGGWPMSVFLTPDLQPFFGGTYWPPHPDPRIGKPSFPQVLKAVQQHWTTNRAALLEQAGELTERLARDRLTETAGFTLTWRILDQAAAQLARNCDQRNGGFGRAPKFPHPMDLRVLLRVWRRTQQEACLEIVRLTLDKMAAGGIYDQLGGGFHRYSVDERWLVPHFEKMLYDNALLTVCYLEGYQITSDENYAQVARDTLDYLLREMTDPQGGFHSTQDADSEGVEGKFYVWTPAEVLEILGPEAAKTFCKVYDVSEVGNFEEHNILHLARTIEQHAQQMARPVAELRAELADSRAKLRAVRDKRIWPGKDDKVLVSWNGLAIEAFAKAAGILNEPKYLVAAVRAMDFILTQLKQPNGRLWHGWRLGQARHAAYLDDYGAIIQALLALYEADFQERWLTEALALAEIVQAQFADPRGGYFYTAADHEQLIARLKDQQDGSVPSGTSLIASAFVRLGRLTGREDLLQSAQKTLQLSADFMSQYPGACGQLLLALDQDLSPPRELVFFGRPDDPGTAQALSALRRKYFPQRLVALRSADAAPGPESPLQKLFEGKTPGDQEPTLYLCEQFTCLAPVSGPAAVLSAIQKLL